MTNGQRQYEGATVFNCRIIDMRHLWTPSTEFKGQQTQKPNYFSSFIVPKTQAQWHLEPALAGIAAACGKLFATSPHIRNWPIVDGDMPAPGKAAPSEWGKGHWIFSASTGNPPNVEIVQAGGQLVKLANRTGVKSGDYCMAGVTAAVKKNDPYGVKLYLNAVVFSAPGEEIVFANSMSGAELMALAQQQGLHVTGFAPSPGGFAPQQPMQQQPFGAPPAGGFTHGSGVGGPAPSTGGPATPFGAGPQPNGAGPAFPSNNGPAPGAGPFAGQPVAAPSGPAPGGGFGQPQNPFGPR